MNARTTYNAAVDAAVNAKAHYERVVGDLVAPYMQQVRELAQDSDRIHEDVLGMDDEGVILASGGPGVTLTWGGRFVYREMRGVFEWEPMTAADEDAVKTVLEYCREGY